VEVTTVHLALKRQDAIIIVHKGFSVNMNELSLPPLDELKSLITDARDRLKAARDYL